MATLKTKKPRGQRPLATCGHGPLKTRTLTQAQFRRLQADGFVNVSITMKGRKYSKRVTKANIRSGRNISYYWRSDSKTVCLRNYKRDRALPKHGRQTKYRPRIDRKKSGASNIHGATGDARGSRV